MNRETVMTAYVFRTRMTVLVVENSRFVMMVLICDSSIKEVFVADGTETEYPMAIWQVDTKSEKTTDGGITYSAESMVATETQLIAGFNFGLVYGHYGHTIKAYAL